MAWLSLWTYLLLKPRLYKTFHPATKQKVILQMDKWIPKNTRWSKGVFINFSCPNLVMPCDTLGLYLGVTNFAISDVLFKEQGNGKKPIYYNIQILLLAKNRYPPSRATSAIIGLCISEMSFIFPGAYSSGFDGSTIQTSNEVKW